MGREATSYRTVSVPLPPPQATAIVSGRNRFGSPCAPTLPAGLECSLGLFERRGGAAGGERGALLYARGASASAGRD